MLNNLLIQVVYAFHLLSISVVVMALSIILYQAMKCNSPSSDTLQLENAKTQIISSGMILLFTLILFSIFKFFLVNQEIEESILLSNSIWFKIMVLFVSSGILFGFFTLLQCGFFEAAKENTPIKDDQESLLKKEPLVEFEKITTLLNERYKKEHL